MQTGRVKFHLPERRYAFMVPDDGSPDVYVGGPILEFAGITKELQRGQKVAYRLSPNSRSSRPAAGDLKLIEATSS